MNPWSVLGETMVLLCHDKQILQREMESHQSTHPRRTYSQGLNVWFVMLWAHEIKAGVQLRDLLSVRSPSYTQHFEHLWTEQLLYIESKQTQLDKILRPTFVYLLVILWHPPTRTELVVVLSAKAALTGSNKCSQERGSLHLTLTLVQSNTAGWCYHTHTR